MSLIHIKLILILNYIIQININLYTNVYILNYIEIYIHIYRDGQISKKIYILIDTDKIFWIIYIIDTATDILENL